MSIVALQKRARRLGEIRLGDTAPTKSGGTRPVKLDTFRLTSVAKGLLDQAAALWGGEVVPWAPSERAAPRWQVITQASELPVIVPPQDPDNVSWYELWSAGGMQRRCDGDHIQVKGDPQPCVCDPDNRECRMVTRLQVMLPDLPDVGVWLLSSTGYYAASEMSMSLEVVMRTASQTGLLPAATLAIDHREIKRPGEPVKQFVVPVLRFADTLGTFIDAPSLEGKSPRSLPGGEAVGEGDGTVQPRLNPPATAPTLDEAIAANPDLVVEAEIVEEPDDEDPTDAWPGLLEILEEDPTDGAMGKVQDRMRRLYAHMAMVELWAPTALHAGLMKAYQEEHLTDLRRASLDEFATRSMDAAKEKVAEAPE